MKDENQIHIETPIGTLFAEKGEDGEDFWVNVYIALNGGETIPLGDFSMHKQGNDVIMKLWEDPMTEDFTHECTVSRRALLGYPKEVWN